MRILMAGFGWSLISACSGGVSEPPAYPTLRGEPPTIIAHREASGTQMQALDGVEVPVFIQAYEGFILRELAR